MGWALKTKARRPRGYWQNLDNLKDELESFVEDHNLAPGVMPTKNELRLHQRNDLRRAIEQMGGLRAVSESVQMKMVQSPGKRRSRKYSAALASTANGSSRKEKLTLQKKMDLNVKDLDNSG